MAEETSKKIKKTTKKTDKKKPRAADNKKKTVASDNKDKDKRKYKNISQCKYKTHDGQVLTPLQAKFIDLYIETGNQRQSYLQAGYNGKQPDAEANRLIRIPKIAEEIRWRLEESKKKSIATAEEVMQYFSDVMKGKIKDQFGLDATLSDRTKAASELAKRLIDIPNKLEAVATGKGTGQATVTISLDWEGMGDTTDEEEQQEKE